jgi:hypothetical protein
VELFTQFSCIFPYRMSVFLEERARPVKHNLSYALQPANVYPTGFMFKVIPR